MSQRNENRPGYKKTKVGWIPEEWGTVRLGEIIQDKRLGANYVNSESEKGLPLIKMGNVGRGRIKLDKVERIPSSLVYDKAYLLEKGDILFNTRNTMDLVGKVAIWNNELPLALYNSNLLKLKFKKSKIGSAIFANYLLNSPAALRQLRGMAIGTTSVAAIYDRDLVQLKASLPPLPEQEKIAEILSTWDEAIDQMRTLIDAKKRRKKALMQQLLTGRLRLPRFGRRRKNNSRFPDDWQSMHARELFGVRSLKNCGYEPVLSVTQDNGVVRRDSLGRRIDASEANAGSYKLVEPGDFVISLRSFQGGIEYSDHKGIVSPAYHVIRPKREVDDAFYKYYFKCHDFIGHLVVAVIGIRDGKQVSYGDFAFMYLPYPSIGEQKSIGRILQAVDDETVTLGKKLTALEKQKRGLMQKLLTGEVRVNL